MLATLAYTIRTLPTYSDGALAISELEAAQRVASEARRINRISLKSLDRQIAIAPKHGPKHWELCRERDTIKRRYANDRRAYRRLFGLSDYDRHAKRSNGKTYEMRPHKITPFSKENYDN